MMSGAIDTQFPGGITLPLGLIAFTATTTTPGEATTFTLLVDGDLAINGYWKQNPETGEWVNLATAVVVEGSRTRLDFSIEDNGVFDTNPALGVIDDPGGIGFMVVLPPSQLGCPWDPFQPDADRDGIPDAVEASLGLNPLVKDNDIFGSGELFVQQLYRDLLGREGEAEGVAYWVDALAGGQSRADLVVGFMALPEFEAHAGAIVRLYHAVLDRSPDFCGFNYWMQQALNGLTGKDLAAAFLHQAEYLNDASGMSDAGFVAMLYDHALQRPADDAGTTYWLAQLGQGMTRAEMLHHVAQSGEARAALADEVTIDMLYLGLLDRAADARGWNHWHRAWSQFEDVAGFIGSASAMPEYVDRFLAEAELTGQRLETDA